MPSRLRDALALAGYQPRRDTQTVARLQYVARNGDLSALSALTGGLIHTVASLQHSRLVYRVTRCMYADEQTRASPLPDTPAWLVPYLAPSEHDACPWPLSRRADREPAWPARPTLVIGGSADIVASLQAVAAVMRHHPAIRGVLIPHAGHTPTLADSCAQRVVAIFLAGPRQSLAPCARAASRPVSYR